jgi:hypothetical protein
MTEVRYNTASHAGATPEARIASRLKNSGDAKNADVVTKHGDGARRTYHNIFHSGHKIQPNTLPAKNAGR